VKVILIVQRADLSVPLLGCVLLPKAPTTMNFCRVNKPKRTRYFRVFVFFFDGEKSIMDTFR
jgi:hypothetical protein